MIEIQNDFARTLTIAAVCDTVDFCSSDLTCETANRVAKRTLPTHLSHANIRFHLAILLLRSVTWKLWKFLCQNLFRCQAITVNVTKSKINVPSPRCHWLHARVRWSFMPQLIARWRDQWSTCLFDPSKSPIFLFELSFFFPKTIPASLDCHSVGRVEHESYRKWVVLAGKRAGSSYSRLEQLASRVSLKRRCHDTIDLVCFPSR